MFAIKYVKKILNSSENHLNNNIEIREFCNQPKEEYSADKVRQVHSDLKSKDLKSKDLKSKDLKSKDFKYDLCYYYISNEYGYKYIIELIITGDAIYRLDTSTENEIVLETWSRGDKVESFTCIEDLLTFLFPDATSLEEIQKVDF